MLSFVANVALVVYQGYRIVQMKLNPIKDELYTDLAKYQEVAKA
jgi:hypothetical protein